MTDQRTSELNPLTELMYHLGRSQHPRVLAGVSALTGGALLSSGFLLPSDALLTTIVGALAGLGIAIVALIAARWIPLLHRNRYALRSRRLTFLVSLVGWMVLARVIIDNDVVADHVGGAVMVAWMITGIAFASRTQEEKEQRAREERDQQEEDIWESDNPTSN